MDRLPCVAFACWLVPFVAGADEPAPAPAPEASAATEAAQPPPTQKIGIRADSKHPPKIGYRYYPKAALAAHQEGTCVVRVRVAADGKVNVVAVVSSSGFKALDSASVHAFDDGGMLPATVDGEPIDDTIDLPVAWRLTR
jgi:periplasmic protein TonB